MRHDKAIGAAEQQLRQAAGISKGDDAAELALFNLADAGNAALDEACGIAFWAGTAFARGVNVAAGDLGSSAAKKYDIEAWFPGQERYREITSTSNTTDFQARRLKIRFKDDEGKNQLVHTLNGTVVTPRHLIALMENHQDGQGSIRIPDALVPFAGFDVIEAG